MATVEFAVFKTTTQILTYMGARAEVTTETHDHRRVGLRTITTRWIDDAHPLNGGHKAGTTTRRTITGDGRVRSGLRDSAAIIIPEHVVPVFTKGQIVADMQGNHFLFIGIIEGIVARVESVATREVFRAPLTDLVATDRTAF